MQPHHQSEGGEVADAREQKTKNSTSEEHLSFQEREGLSAGFHLVSMSRAWLGSTGSRTQVDYLRRGGTPPTVPGYQHESREVTCPKGTQV